MFSGSSFVICYSNQEAAKSSCQLDSQQYFQIPVQSPAATLDLCVMREQLCVS